MIGLNAISVAELRRLKAILQGVQDAATTIMASKAAWPEEAALSISTEPVVIYPEAYEIDARVGSDRLLQRGVLFTGTLVQRGYSAGLLGENRLAATAEAMYAALVLDTIDLTEIGFPAGLIGPDSDLSIKRGRLMTTGGNNGTEIVFVCDWTLRIVLTTGYLLNDPDET